MIAEGGESLALQELTPQPIVKGQLLTAQKYQ